MRSNRWRLCCIAAFLSFSAAAQSVKTYRSLEYGWSVTYPASWHVDGSRPGFVLIASDQLHGLCGIHSGEVRFDTVDEFADFMLANMAESLRAQKGIESATLWRRPRTLRSGEQAIEAVVAMRPGGMSHLVFVLIAHRGFGIDCEAEEANWPNVTQAYDGIVASFEIGSPEEPR